MKPLKIGNREFETNVILAPMAGITDIVYRSLVRQFTQTAIVYTEMISSEALKANRPHPVCDYNENERPIFFQLAGHKPNFMAEAAKKLEEKADVIDINMGCPVGKIVKNQDGASLMNDLKLASSIISSVKNSISLPLNVKCRLGWDSTSKNVVDFAKMAQESGADSLIVHGRTKKEMYSGTADWSLIREVKKNVSIPIIANGDINSIKSAIECLAISCADGVAIGRGALGNPFLVYQIEHFFKTGEALSDLTLDDKLELALKHTRLEIEYKGEEVGIKFMRKFFGYYIKGIQGASKLRGELVRVSSYKDLITIFEKNFSKNRANDLLQY
jgi:tRNA-dihydrouridine synthase B